MLWANGQRGTLTDTRCNDSSPGGFVCSGRLSLAPGTYELRVSASFDGAESERSAPIRVTVTSGAVSLAPAATAPALDSHFSSGVCAGLECFDVHVLADGIGSVTAIAAPDEERVFFAEDGRWIRTAQRGALARTPALALDEGESRIAGLAAGARFAVTREIFAAIAGRRGDGIHELRIVRYREAGGLLGEAATIVSGLPIAAEGLAPLAVDPEDLVYLALPEPEDPHRKFTPLHGGVVLRYTRDGLTPGANPASSPVLAAGLAKPRALLFGGPGRRLWVTGEAPGGGRAVGAVSFDVRGGSAPSRLSAGPLTRLAARTRADHPALAALAGAPALAALGQVTAAAAIGAGAYLAVVPEGAPTRLVRFVSRRAGK
jgi:glucose/arabinose dehydrogenase